MTFKFAFNVIPISFGQFARNGEVQPKARDQANGTFNFFEFIAGDIHQPAKIIIFLAAAAHLGCGINGCRH